MQSRKLPSDWLSELKSKNDIVTTISSYIPVVKKGRQYWARCPFHNEKTPSFSINEEGQYYHCFGCGESGDVITFVQKMESISTGDAIRKLAEKAGLEMPMLEDGEKIAEKKKRKDESIKALNLTKNFYIKNLYEPSAKLAQEYVKKRGFKKSDLDRFQIGYSNGNSIMKYLESNKIDREIMLEAGIITEIDGNAYDHIYNRLAFPIINTYGDCIGFSGRILENNPEKAKYKNTSQTILFDKGSTIYGINLLKEEKKKGNLDKIILVE
ncbi:MAG: CHC2 zinc finger domain-containing protein, partial [Clostridia bacterium]|nr:CHC2 zinc finger domain-containing protein [Clostridia bacterium]